ncbi:MAG: hypothetical protein AAF809_13070 [Bacteroidota bacterium]
MSRIFLVLGLFFLITLPVTAQQNRVGLGVSVQPDIIFSVSAGAALAPQLYIPVTLGAFRFEPGIGFSRRASSLDDETFSDSALRLGTGLFYYQARDDNDALYVGARIGLIRISETNPFDIDESQSRTDFIIAPTLGGEHYFGRLSLGVEGQLEYTRIGSFIEDDEVTRSQFQTRALFFVRYHFSG